MKNVFAKLSVVFGAFFVSSMAFAADGMGGSDAGLIAIGAALAIGCATYAAASGQAKATAKMLEGVTRNPGSADKVFMPFILGLVFMEFQALLGFVIAFLLQGKF